jgi:hypothetical protein
MMRFEMPCAISNPAPLILSKSWIGGFSMRSTSPESSAATRGPAEENGRQITLAHCGLSPQ